MLQQQRLIQLDKETKQARKIAAERQASSTDPERQKYITEQAKERAAQKAQRARILAEIENDKAERRARAEREKQAATHVDTSPPATSATSNVTQGNATTGTTTWGNATAGHTTNGGVARGFTGLTKLTIRQPDSRVLKGEFKPEMTLGDIRRWIDANRLDGNAPYVLQTTFPTRTFEVAEEQSESVGSVFGKGGQCIMKV